MGWYRHITLSMLALAYLAVVRTRAEDEAEKRGSQYCSLASNRSGRGAMKLLQGNTDRQNITQQAMQSEISVAAGNATIVGVGNITGTLLKFGTNLLIQRSFGAEMYGFYSISLAVVSFVAAVCTLGLDTAMVHYLAVYRSKGQTGMLRGVTIFCTLTIVVIGVLGAILLLIFTPWLAAIRKEPQLIPLLQIMSPMVPLLCMQATCFGGLQGLKAFAKRVLSDRLIPPLVLLLFLGGTLIFYHAITGIALATLTSQLVGTVLSLYFLGRLIARIDKQKPEYNELRNWVGFAIPNFLIFLTEVIVESVDVLLLTLLLIAPTIIGQYTTSVKISDTILLPLVSFNTMFAPSIAEFYSNGERQKLSVMFQIVTKWTIIFSFPMFLIVTLFAQPLLSLSGPSFVAAWPLLMVMALGILVSTGTGCVGYMLVMTGHQKLSLLDSVVAVIINILLCVILTTHYGAIGAAISVTFTLSFVNILKLFQVYILHKMLPYRWDTLKPLGAGIVSAILIAALLFLYRNIPTPNQLLLIPVFLGCYIGFLLIFKLSPDDKIVVGLLSRKILCGKR